MDSKAQIAFNDVTREMAERLDVPLVDLESIIRKESNEEKRNILL